MRWRPAAASVLAAAALAALVTDAASRSAKPTTKKNSALSTTNSVSKASTVPSARTSVPQTTTSSANTIVSLWNASTAPTTVWPSNALSADGATEKGSIETTVYVSVCVGAIVLLGGGVTICLWKRKISLRHLQDMFKVQHVDRSNGNFINFDGVSPTDSQKRHADFKVTEIVDPITARAEVTVRNASSRHHQLERNEPADNAYFSLELSGAALEQTTYDYAYCTLTSELGTHDTSQAGRCNESSLSQDALHMVENDLYNVAPRESLP